MISRIDENLPLSTKLRVLTLRNQLKLFVAGGLIPVLLLIYISGKIFITHSKVNEVYLQLEKHITKEIIFVPFDGRMGLVNRKKNPFMVAFNLPQNRAVLKKSGVVFRQTKSYLLFERRYKSLCNQLSGGCL